MRDNKIFIIILLYAIAFLSCKENKVANSLEFHSKQENLIPQKGYFPFTSIGDDFIFQNYKLAFNKLTRNFTLYKNNEILGEVKLGYINYDGPGFKAYINEQSQIQSIIIEATADIGTAWYYSVLLQDDKITNQFLIEEPRTDSEKYTLDKFINFNVLGDSVKYRFKKNLIANYSKIPKGLLSDKDYVYLIQPLKEVNSTKSQKNEIIDDFINDMSKDYQLVVKKSHDVNSDGIEDEFLILKNKKEFNSDDDSSKKSLIVIFLSNNGSFKKIMNSKIFPNDSNDQFDNIVFTDENTFTIKLYNEIPNLYFIEKQITFKYENHNLILSKYSITKGNNQTNLKVSKLKTIYFETFNANDSKYH